MARPKIEIDAAELEKLASFGMTDREIADFFGVSQPTISRRFVSELTKGRSNLKKSLRRKQVEMALNGNVTMLIWIGKQYLGQADKQETKDTTDTDIDEQIKRELARLAARRQAKDAGAIEGDSADPERPGLDTPRRPPSQRLPI